MAQAVPSWLEIPAVGRRRLAVLIGRLARRRLPSMNPEAETAHEGAVYGHDRPGAAGQGPAAPS